MQVVKVRGVVALEFEACAVGTENLEDRLDVLVRVIEHDRQRRATARVAYSRGRLGSSYIWDASEHFGALSEEHQSCVCARVCVSRRLRLLRRWG
jgi:hypothetical protein